MGLRNSTHGGLSKKISSRRPLYTGFSAGFSPKKTYLVGRVGVEPTRCHHRRILSPLRLPIPPPPQLWYFGVISGVFSYIWCALGIMNIWFFRESSGCQFLKDTHTISLFSIQQKSPSRWMNIAWKIHVLQLNSAHFLQLLINSLALLKPLTPLFNFGSYCLLISNLEELFAL